MPGYRGHLLGGLGAFGITLAALLSVSMIKPTLLTLGEWLLFSLAGSLFPDVDTKSKGQRYFYWVLFGLLLYLGINKQFEIMAALSIVAVLPLIVHHRGLFHKLWFIVIFVAGLSITLCVYFPRCSQLILYDCLFFIAGAISHLWLDLGFKRMLRSALK